MELTAAVEAATSNVIELEAEVEASTSADVELEAKGESAQSNDVEIETEKEVLLADLATSLQFFCCTKLKFTRRSRM